MKKVLLTAFGPFGRWKENSSWLALVELTREMPQFLQLVTRKYPVSLTSIRERIETDMHGDYDFAIHLGQTNKAPRLLLESVALNVATDPEKTENHWSPVVPDGPVAYQTTLPLEDWAAGLRKAEIPADVSFYAGTYMCNAALYLSHHYAKEYGIPTQSLFVHLPLATSQLAKCKDDFPSLPTSEAARALKVLLQLIHKWDGTVEA